MAAITTGGSILDINTLVSNLMTLERQPLAKLAAKEGTETAKLSAFGQIKGVLSSLQTAVEALKNADKFNASKATVSGDGFTATSKVGAASGSYSVEVLALAREQRIALAFPSGGDENSTGPSIGPGKLTIEFGTVDGSDFVTDVPLRSASLEFEGSTLAELRDAINNSATLGIKASIVNDGTADQLVLTGTATGRNMAFRLSGEDGLADLSYNPAASEAEGFQAVQTAESARLKVDGIEVVRGKNTISDVIDGVTLTLTKDPADSTGPVKGTVTVAEDPSGAKSAIEAFVKAYNEANTTIRSLTAYDAENKQAATLTGDSTARSIQGQLRNAVGATLAGLEGASSLAEIGVAFDRSGALVIDNAKLDAALKDPDKNVGALLAGKDGLAASIGSSLERILDTRSGMIAGRTDSINSTIKALTKQYEALEARLVTVQERYRLQFSKLDTMLAGMNQTSTYLAQQLANLPGANK